MPKSLQKTAGARVPRAKVISTGAPDRNSGGRASVRIPGRLDNKSDWGEDVCCGGGNLNEFIVSLILIFGPNGAIKNGPAVPGALFLLVSGGSESGSCCSGREGAEKFPGSEVS